MRRMRFVDDQSRILEGLRRPARLATHIAAHLPLAKHLADITLVASMLHDVGKLILVRPARRSWQRWGSRKILPVGVPWRQRYRHC